METRALLPTDQDMTQLRAEVTRLRETARSFEDLAQRREEQLDKALRRSETAKRALDELQAKFRGLNEQTLTGIAGLDGVRYLHVNTRFAQLFGCQADELVAVPVAETIAHFCRSRVVRQLRDCIENESCPGLIELEGLKKDGSPVHLELAASRIEMGGQLVLICTANDITPRKLAERKVQALNRWIAELSLRDLLTGLYSRRFAEASLERELYLARRNKGALTVVLCDVDRFRSVNEAIGQRAGDEVLKALAELLQRRCRKSDVACRYGGDEFLLVFPGMPADAGVRWAEKMRAVIAGTRIAKGATALQTTASFGVATYPQHGPGWQELIASAAAAQAVAKFAGPDHVMLATTPDSPTADVHTPAGAKAERRRLDLASFAAQQG